ncbi:DsbA family protein [Mycolicibacterium psychrotolerans]|uniref:Protein disulfide-isomerase n=1 Tax=Mycolicibacterium psychrotolerans TaxID=216929 RepID=A0A7I7M591_9MYCO|nr:thioredoxin domain-containing protein [Mycolicibacterium psychrotolerans]BBX66703.1 protein disulfide-isomerase [Mycolicibacterium psychrotolerans]
MGRTRTVLAVATIGLMVGVVGCSKDVTGTARPDPATAPLALSDDGFGIVAGYDDADAQIEIFTEPQCTHCHDLQQDFGDQIAYYVTVGGLQVTYRPLTFLDQDTESGYSATVANAMFVAAEPAGDATTTGTQFQRFVEQLWAQQDPGGPAFTGDELRDIARGAGLPEAVAESVSRDQEAVDIAAMEEANFSLLYDTDPVSTGTPTVVDLRSGEKIDLTDDAWLDQLVAS